MRFLRQSLMGLFLAALTVALLFYAGYTVSSAVQARMNEEPRKPPARERVFAVDVVSAEVETIAPELIAFGEIESRRSLELRAGTSGRVVTLDGAFVEGGDVVAGTVLMQVDTADAEAALARVQSDMLDAKAEARDAERGLELARDELAAAQEQLELRDRALKRQRDLESRRVGTAAAVETAELAVSAARQAVLSRRQALTQAQARIDQASTRVARTEIALAEAARGLDDTVIVAPFDGTLSDVSVIQGRLVSQNEKLGQLVDPTALDVAFRVSTTQYARILDAAGALIDAPVQVTLDVSGIDLAATGRLSRDAAVAGEGQTGRLIYARLDEAPAFKPGDFVTVRVQEPEMAGLVRLPSGAYGSDGAVLVISADNRLESLPVTLVRRQGDDVLVRGEGLAGRLVVSERTPLLGVGISVEPLQKGEAPIVPQAPEMVELTNERRAKLVAFIEGNTRMPQEAKARVLARLQEPKVPAQMIERIESRMGG